MGNIKKHKSQVKSNLCRSCNAPLINRWRNTKYCSVKCQKRNELNGRIHVRWTAKINKLNEMLERTEDPKQRADIERLIKSAQEKIDAAPYIPLGGYHVEKHQ